VTISLRLVVCFKYLEAINETEEWYCRLRLRDRRAKKVAKKKGGQNFTNA